MPNILYQIQFYSEWQCGSGMTSASDMASVAIQDKDGLPYIPGRTLKGLLRESAEILAEMDTSKSWNDFVQKCFGSPTNKKSDQSQEGCCHFSNAELSGKVRNTIIRERQQHVLFRDVTSTAIENTGQAKKYSLRKFEMTVPLTLFAQVSDCPEEYTKYFQDCMQFIKRLGSKRNRGWGRCDLRMLKKEVK